MNTGYSTIASSDFGNIDATSQSSVGAISVTDDYRKFRYVKFANTATIAAGALVYAAAPTAVAATVTANQSLAPGARTFKATLGAAVTAGALDGGFVAVTDATGTYSLRVKSVDIGASGASVVVRLHDFIPDGLNLATATALSFTQNPYVATTTTKPANGVALGTTVNQIPAQTAGASVYAYVQTNGVNLPAASQVAD